MFKCLIPNYNLLTNYDLYATWFSHDIILPELHKGSCLHVGGYPVETSKWL